MLTYVRFTDEEGHPVLLSLDTITGFAVVQDDGGKPHVLVFNENAEGGIPIRATMADIEAFLTAHAKVWRI